MRFTRVLKAPTLALQAYRKALDKHMREVAAKAATEWLNTVLREVPVWSGASQATFKRLADQIEYGLDIAPVAKSREAEGMAQSTGKLTATDSIYAFEYGTSLPWLIWNEYHNANVDPDDTLFAQVLKEGPYYFQVKGQIAFERFAETVTLPKVSPYIKEKRVR
jgi:hypothetical protein